MKKQLLALLLLGLALPVLNAQDSFKYQLSLEPADVPGLPGLQSYAHAQYDGKWLVIGGRRDGLHARQPFNAFPAAQNNDEIYVIDVEAGSFWKTPVESLPSSIAEQLQATNMNFFQDGEVMYIIGGYAFSPSANEHLTFPYLTAVKVPELMEAVMSQSPIGDYFSQIEAEAFAVTGGYLGKIGDAFYLVGGHRFDGRYNPHGPDHGPGFEQTYTDQVRKFTLSWEEGQLSYAAYEAWTDPVHLHRRDYNLIPQIFPDGSEGYTISSGVFQVNADLPYLYPVDIRADRYEPITGFNQYLANYHCANAALYDSESQQMHHLFFGGMSQHYYEGDQLVQDDQVPFVKTISRLTRFADGSIQEYKMPIEMPSLQGAGSEFFVNGRLPVTTSGIIQLGQTSEDTILIGHIFGGIVSPLLNPFNSNQTSATSADHRIYAVRLIKEEATTATLIEGQHAYTFSARPNPVQRELDLTYNLPRTMPVHFFLSGADGRIVAEGQLNGQMGENQHTLTLKRSLPSGMYWLTLVFDHQYYATQALVKE